MIRPLGLIVLLTLTARLANGERVLYPFLNMGGATPYDKIPCPENCNLSMKSGSTIVSSLLNSLFKTVSLPVDFCEKCVAEGMASVTFTHECFMSPNKDVFDHYINMKFPNLIIKCECNLSNSASITAAKINEGKVPEGQCGFENYKNTQECKPITCDGSQGGKGQSPVELTASLSDSELSTVIRVDTRVSPSTKKPSVFPLRAALATNSDAPVTHVGPSEFDGAWECLTKNMEGVVCHLFANSPVPFFECLQNSADTNVISAVLYAFGKC